MDDEHLQVPEDLGTQSAWDDGSAQVHEAAAHQTRNWVRLTYDCNDKCIFCLDSNAHDGEIRAAEEVKRQILDGRRKGAKRLILSGGEPTIHPRFIDFVKLGSLAGYERVQTVTNGRMFRYEAFLKRALDAGLQEITFSIHGPNAKIHDALVGVRGAYEEEIQGLKLALADGRPIVNVDVCVNKGNVKHMPAMIEGLYEMGVREFDLLQVIPFGSAWRNGKEVLFYDIDKMKDVLDETMAWSKKPDVHLWMNRFPVRHLEGFHELIQDPYKLNDEVRGRKEEYTRWIDAGEPLDCREPRRCGYCYMKRVCDAFENLLEVVSEGQSTSALPRVRVPAEDAETALYTFGGDPANLKKKRLPVLRREYPALTAQLTRAGVNTLCIAGENAEAALKKYDELSADGNLANVNIEFELRTLAQKSEILDALCAVPRLTRVDVMSADDALRLCARASAHSNEALEVGLALTKANAARLDEFDARVVSLYQPTWERASDARDHDVDLRTLVDTTDAQRFRIRGLPRCIARDSHVDEPETLDAAMLAPTGRPEPFRFVRRFIESRYQTKSLRCGDCVHDLSCRGIHVSHVRAFGFDAMQPILEPARAGDPVE